MILFLLRGMLGRRSLKKLLNRGGSLLSTNLAVAPSLVRAAHYVWIRWFLSRKDHLMIVLLLALSSRISPGGKPAFLRIAVLGAVLHARIVALAVLIRVLSTSSIRE